MLLSKITTMCNHNIKSHTNQNRPQQEKGLLSYFFSYSGSEKDIIEQNQLLTASAPVTDSSSDVLNNNEVDLYMKFSNKYWGFYQTYFEIYHNAYNEAYIADPKISQDSFDHKFYVNKDSVEFNLFNTKNGADMYFSSCQLFRYLIIVSRSENSANELLVKISNLIKDNGTFEEIEKLLRQAKILVMPKMFKMLVEDCFFSKIKNETKEELKEHYKQQMLVFINRFKKIPPETPVWERISEYVCSKTLLYSEVIEFFELNLTPKPEQKNCET